MKAPLSWLKDYVNIDIEVEEYAHKMTMSGSKVEAVEKLFEDLNNIVIGRIVNIEEHPNADKLVVCLVDVGHEVIGIVTGAKNIKVDDIVPVALLGALLPNGQTIKKGDLRGVLSEGMLCSLGELGLDVSDHPYAVLDGIFILDGEYTLGDDIRDALSLRDTVVEFEITSNRPDCLSIKGLGLESAVTLGKEFQTTKFELREDGDPVTEYINVEIKDNDLCPIYVARVCTDICIQPSPEWMRKRLRAAGVRPINNVVDITNYVMLEYGQPMHAFDIEYIEGNKITVRRAVNKEKITTLDGIERELDNNDLVISDNEKAIALAGIMGGQDSEIKDDTKTVVIESANFDPSSVRLTAKKIGLRTESSGRFEKGLDPQNAISAIDRACQLIEMLNAGKVCKGSIIKGSKTIKQNKIPFDEEKINKLLGSEIKKEEMIKILGSLQFEIHEDHVTAPSFRADVVAVEDVAEEIARFHDYNSIVPTLPQSTVSGAGLKTKTQHMRDVVRKSLSALGFYEAYTFSFNSPKIYEKLNMETQDAVKITNPLGEDFGIMRTTTFDGLLKSLSINYNRRIKAASLFEISKVYIPNEEGQLPDEPEKVTLGEYGQGDFYNLKGTIIQLFDSLGIDEYRFITEINDPTFHPGRSAKLYFNGVEAGIAGQVNPIVAKNYDLPRETILGVIDFGMLCKNADFDKQYSKLPKYPSVNRDLSILLDIDIEAAKVEDIIRKTGGTKLETLELFDIYMGKQLGEDKKSLAYSLTWRDRDKTLSEEDIHEPMQKILGKLEKELGAVLRQT